MKIGLCACYENRNYGSMLQALASQLAINQLGCSCEMIRYQKHYTYAEILRQAPRVLNGGNIRKFRSEHIDRRLAKAYPIIEEQRSKRCKSFDRFRDQTFTSLSKVYIGFDALKEGSKNYDAIVVGSDQLWLPMGLPTNFYNLQFVDPGVRRVSYATSFGVSQIPWYQKRRTADYLRKIDYLSVREESGVRICREIAGVEAKIVVDPTLLLTREQWLEALPGIESNKEPYIFCYFLGENPLCRSEARAVAKYTGLPIVTLRHLDQIVPSDEQFGDVAPYDIDPADFVNLIRNAEFVITDSFHGTVFSIINRKKFVTFYRFGLTEKHSRNTRIDSLLAQLGLVERLAVEEGAALQIVGETIDFNHVNNQLESWRNDSRSFLEEAFTS